MKLVLILFLLGTARAQLTDDQLNSNYVEGTDVFRSNQGMKNTSLADVTLCLVEKC